MNPELVSAVIPTYNYGRYVTEAVESALAQTYRAVEIIVVDDGSTDDTRDQLRPYGDRIRYIYQPNQGLSAARNTGIRAARGRLIALLDSDDLWHPRRLEVQMRYLASNPDLGLVASDHVSDLRTGWRPLDDPDNPRVRPVTMRELLVRSRFGSCGVLVRRECFDDLGYFDTSLRSAEDRDMWIRIASRYRVVKLDLPLWYYRPHGGSMSTAAARMEENEFRVLRRALDTQPAVRGCLLFRSKVCSYTLKSAAYRYDVAGDRCKAITRVLRSLLLWPFPYRADERITRFERPKMLALFLLRAAGSWLRHDGRNAPRSKGNPETLATAP